MLEEYEEFTPSQIQRLKRYVTSTTKNIFVLRNLPEVIKGALFSRYSRSNLGLRSLLVKEFMTNQETSFESIVGEQEPKDQSADHAIDQLPEQILAIQKAQSFYDRILDGYGDDSIGELGGAHLALENISMLAAKVIEDSRIGGSPLEKSTRYIYFDQKVKGEYLFYREPVLMTSAFKQLYLTTCNMLFDTYAELIPPLTEQLQESFPKTEDMSKAAYSAALRAKVLDCLRGLLPAGALTNMGLFGNGRFFQQLLQRLQCQPLVELQEVGKSAYEELSKEIPSFVRRADTAHRHQQAYADYMDTMQSCLKMVARENVPDMKGETGMKVSLIQSDPESPIRVAAALLFPHSQASFEELLAHCQTLPPLEIERILEAGCSARENRRHKSPRALEHASFTFEIVADFGAYRDLHRHRVLTQERQLLSCNYGYFVPEEIKGTAMESRYVSALVAAQEAYDTIAKELPEEAQYVVPMAYNIRWYFHINLRSLQWLTELRSAPAGHSTYRYIAQAMAKQVSLACPSLERFFKFVDYDGHDLGRIGQEQKKAEKQASAPEG